MGLNSIRLKECFTGCVYPVLREKGVTDRVEEMHDFDPMSRGKEL